MAFKVTDFKTNLVKGGGGARPSLYKIDVNGEGDASGFSFSDKSNILVKAAALPADNIAALPENFGALYEVAMAGDQAACEPAYPGKS